MESISQERNSVRFFTASLSWRSFGSPVLNLSVPRSLLRLPTSGSRMRAVRLPTIGGLRSASSDLAAELLVFQGEQADREAAEMILAVVPKVRDMARANRALLARAVRHLTRDKGITQFLDVGTGIPASPNVHETAAGHVTSHSGAPSTSRSV